jgi:hypothetical protein
MLSNNLVLYAFSNIYLNIISKLRATLDLQIDFQDVEQIAFYSSAYNFSVCFVSYM